MHPQIQRKKSRVFGKIDYDKVHKIFQIVRKNREREKKIYIVQLHIMALCVGHAIQAIVMTQRS